MDTETFMNIVAKSQKVDVSVLIEKGYEYSMKGDRLAQFYKAAELKLSGPAVELVNMATKHFTAIVTMADNPTDFHMRIWREKTTDLRNYLHLLEAVLIDMGVE